MRSTPAGTERFCKEVALRDLVFLTLLFFVDFLLLPNASFVRSVNNPFFFRTLFLGTNLEVKNKVCLLLSYNCV